jgi:hypothetical protein
LLQKVHGNFDFITGYDSSCFGVQIFITWATSGHTLKIGGVYFTLFAVLDSDVSGVLGDS